MSLHIENDEKIKMFVKRLNEVLDLRLYPAMGHGRTACVQEEFAVSRIGAHNWLHGKSIPHRKKRVEIANKLGVNLLWLESGEGEMLKVDPSFNEVKYPAIKIPLITLASAYNIENITREDLYKETLISTKYQTDDSIFAVKYIGNSMSPKFTSGCILIIKKNVNLSDGDYVLATVSNIPEAICRQYITGSEKNYLIAINSKFEAISINLNVCIIGAIIEVQNHQ